MTRTGGERDGSFEHRIPRMNNSTGGENSGKQRRILHGSVPRSLANYCKQFRMASFKEEVAVKNSRGNKRGGI